LLQQIDALGRQAAGPDARRTLYDTLVRYARTMEARLGTRHPRYQAQRAVLGDFIKQFLMAEAQAPAPAAVAPPADAAARYEALFEHFWIDRVIDAREREALTQASASLGLSPAQVEAIEARAMEH
jgi:hypothetical protein